MWRGVLEERLREIQLLLDKTVQVLARKIYMEGIFQQATDNCYWDLWNCQKLSSELELKRQHIVEVDQDLITQLVELERHFNSIEFNKFGRSEAVQMNERAIPSLGNSRQQALKRVHNTMGAQLSAAEKLSECLWKQMAALSMEPPAEKKTVKWELFETLGLKYDGASLYSPGDEKAPDTSTKQLLITSSSDTAEKQSRRYQYTSMKSSGSEKARRRRDSLDMKWSSTEPPKTTVKRILLQEDNQNSSPSRYPVTVEKQHLRLLQKVKGSGRSAAGSSMLSDSSAISSLQHKSKTISGIQVNQSIEHPVTPLSPRADGHADPGVQEVLTGSSPALLQQSALTSSAGLNGSRENRTLSGKFRSSLLLHKTSESFSGRDSRDIHHSETRLFDMPFISEGFPALSTTSSKNSLEISNFRHREVGRAKPAVKEVKHALVSTNSSLSDSNSSCEASVSQMALINSYPSFSQKIVHTGSAPSKSHPGGTMLTSAAMQSISSLTSPFDSSSTAPSSLSKPSAATSSHGMLGKFSSTSEANIDTDQKIPQSHLLVSSSVVSPSTLPFSAPKQDGLSSATYISVDGNLETLESGSQPNVAVFSSKGEGNSMKQTVVSNSISAIGEAFKTPISVSQSGPSSASNLHTEPTVPSTPVTELTASFKSENQLNIGGMSSPASETPLNAKFEQPWPAGTNSPVAVFSGMSNNGKNASSAVINGDEMEEEAPESSLTTELALGNLRGMGIGSTPNLTVEKLSPFGTEMMSRAATPLNSPFMMPAPSGELFRPASFNFQSPLFSQPSQPANIGTLSSGFSSLSASQGPAASGFGQPAQFGLGQQALGSVLGAFGQSRQLGASPTSSGIAPPSGFGTGLSGTSTGGFGRGFSGVASAGGGFSSLNTGGFGGGFAAAATSGGGFAAAATAGAGFSSGGFGAFSNQGGGGFSTFAGGSGAGRPPSELFTQMRK